MTKLSDCTRQLSPLKPIELKPLPKRPLVSVLVSSYNYGRYLSDAIESALRQTYKNWELIICDDGSTDSSLQILDRYQSLDARIKVICQRNGGQSLALNAAFRESTGSIICLLDADDIFMPKKVQHVVDALTAAPQSGLAVNAMLLVDAARRPIGEIPFLHQLPSGWQGASLCLSAPHFLPAIPPSSGLSLHRSLANAIFPLPSRLTANADGVIQVLAPIMTPIVAVRTPMSEYRIHGFNTTAVSRFTEDQVRKLDGWHKEIWRAWRDYLASPCSGLPPGFPLPSEVAPTPMSYAWARFRSDPLSRAIFRRIPTAYFETLPRWYRWFWRGSTWMPTWLFRRAFAFFYGQTKPRILIGRTLRACRNAGGKIEASVVPAQDLTCETRFR